MYHLTHSICYGYGYGDQSCRKRNQGAKDGLWDYQPPIRGFMDDLTLTTTTHIQARWVLPALEDSVSWARMKFKAKTSRYLAPRKGRVDMRVKMQIQGEEIPSIVGNPIKCLEKWINNSSQTRKASRSNTKKKLLSSWAG